MILHTAALAAILAIASTFPTELIERQYGQISGGAATCTEDTSYSVDAQSAPFETPERIGTDQFCTSTKSDTCTVGAGYSVSIGVTITVGGGLDLSEILSVTGSVSWSYTTTQSTTVGETCPKGGFVCGLMYKNTNIEVKGDKIRKYADNCGAIKGQEIGRDPYVFQAPALTAGRVITEYAVCISNTNGPKHLAKRPKGIQLCPSGA
ncbi:uncharacterized protein KY384_002399 [Bacidia gigantensis]|uniref:uncharacterized protein n=1 Tax=Bacidia gigantensis TaxID=2732470 RepID=UPI001D0539FA|nr:uncharacterized protein KY384_002399 [Bacidia gigantensis]KAG8532522.1 hypothetical protein KY384_002399 [Bacidia gigantensis]